MKKIILMILFTGVILCTEAQQPVFQGAFKLDRNKTHFPSGVPRYVLPDEITFTAKNNVFIISRTRNSSIVDVTIDTLKTDGSLFHRVISGTELALNVTDITNNQLTINKSLKNSNGSGGEVKEYWTYDPASRLLSIKRLIKQSKPDLNIELTGVFTQIP